jgi:predicted alpha/beta superfamily hydrolase
MTEFVDTEMAEILPTPLFDRLITLENFDDGGLTSGSRDISIYLPDGYDKCEDHFPVIYFNDGQCMLKKDGRNSLDINIAYDQLILDGLIKPAIFVGISSLWPTRAYDLTPTAHKPDLQRLGGGGLGGYYKFISELLKPTIDKHYRTKPEPAYTGIAGFSLGGSAAFTMAYVHSETFGMAGCMSPSLCWDQEYALNLVKNDEGNKKEVRFWLDAGGGEYDPMWLDAARAYKLLEQHGWIPGDDLAAYFDYAADHSFVDGGRRMREMLHFLLRKEPLLLENYRLVSASNPEAEKMDLGTGGRRIPLGAEAWYKNGLRLTVPQPGITISDPSIVTLDKHDPILLQGVSLGETTISSTYMGHTASLTVIGNDPNAALNHLPCPLAAIAPSIEADFIGDLNLPYKIIDTNEATVARFGVWHDPEYVHIAVHVRDNVVVRKPGPVPWDQDSFEITFDSRSEADIRAGSKWIYGYSDFLLFSLNPGQPGEQIHMHYPETDEWLHKLHTGIDATCVVAPGGYKAILSIPVSYLDDRQEGHWTAFRLNICINDYETPSGPNVETRWQTDWQKNHSLICSGMFRKE